LERSKSPLEGSKSPKIGSKVTNYVTSNTARRLAGTLLFLALNVVAAAAAAGQGLPPELPLPSGVAVSRVDHTSYGQDDFSHPTARGPWEHPNIAGETWRAFLKGDPKSLNAQAWKAALTGAGWQVFSESPVVARRGDWWAKIGLDRLVLVRQTAAEAFALAPPGDKIEALEPNHDVPYLPPLPNSTRLGWKNEEHVELKGAGPHPEPWVLGPAVKLLYQGGAGVSNLEVQARYNAALQKAGWDVLLSESGGVTGAHYTRNGRDVWAKISPLGASYSIEVADMGAAADQQKLAAALESAGHVALYGIYFDTDKATLRPDSEATLVQIQKLLTSHPALKVGIEGHTDNTGNRPHNQTLSDDRAASVKQWLVAHGINAARLSSKGFADSKPVADNGTPQGRALNRRVELSKP
jgi:outer membrane protein OmpA-like peptidoglycan-associated protein